MISSATYKSYSDNLAAAYGGIDNAIDTLDLADAIYTDMLSSVNTNKESAALDYRSNIDSCVGALQQHVQGESGMDVDDWITSVGIKVKERFAEASDALGFDISSGNIE